MINDVPLVAPEDADARLRDFIEKANDARARQNTELQRYLERFGRTRVWTPTFSFATPGDLSVSYAVQFGEYRAIQRSLKLWVGLNFTPTFTTSSGNIEIGGIPLAVAGDNSLYRAAGAVVYSGLTLGAGYTQVNVMASNGNDFLWLTESGSGKSFALLTSSAVTSGSQVLLECEVEYRF